MGRVSEMRFHWSISVLPVDPDFVPCDAVLDAALALFSGMSVCMSLRPQPKSISERHARPRFYGSEGFSYVAICPICGHQVDRKGDEKGTPGRRWFAHVDELAAQGVDGEYLFRGYANALGGPHRACRPSHRPMPAARRR
jgi:hypothetical protein